MKASEVQAAAGPPDTQLAMAIQARNSTKVTWTRMAVVTGTALFARRVTMAGDSDADRVWELMDKISTCMLTTHDGDHLRSRPMEAFVRRDEDAVYFLGDARQHKDDE